MPRRAHRLLSSVAATLALALLGGLAITAAAPTPAHAAVYENFEKVYSANANGEIALVGNTLMTCLAGSTGCAAAQSAAAGNAYNNNFSSQFVDVDGDASTFNSSSASLNVPAGGSVLFAALVWGGRTPATAGTVHSDPTLRKNVRFTVPSGSSTIAHDLTGTVAVESTTAAGGYQGYVEVTDLVAAAGGGVYSVANVQSTSSGTNNFAGWSLIVAIGDGDAPMRNLTIFKGFASLSNSTGNTTQALTVSGFLTPPAGAVKTTLGAVTYEGDRGLVGDSLALNGTTITDGLNPADDIFNSTIAVNGAQGSGRSPAYNNQLGFDADLVKADGILANNATSATLTLKTVGDQYFPGVVTFSTELYDPKLYGTKAATLKTDVDGDGQIDIGDTLHYAVGLQNIGLDTSTDSTFFDAIPTGTRYVNGSITIDGGSLSDQATDDAAEFSATGGNGNGHIVARVGAGAGSSGGDIPTYDTTDSLQDVYTVGFDVIVDSSAVPGQALVNAASLTYRGKTTKARNASVSNAVVSPMPADPASTNSSPVAKDYVISTTPTAASPSSVILPLAYATDPDGDAVRLVAVTDAAGGTVTANPDGTITYTPRADFAGRDVFTYTIEDAAGNRSTGVIRLDVVNATPTAVDDAQNVSRNRPTPVTVLSNDTDGNDDALAIRSITASGVTVAGNGTVTTVRGGTVTLLNGALNYTPPSAGLPIGATDGFSYVVEDTRGGSDDAQVTLTSRDVAPIASADTATTLVDRTTDVTVLANDSDADGDTLTVDSVTTPAHGSATINSDGTVHYVPNAGYAGSDTFGYSISDGNGATASATVTVKVDGPPVAIADSTTTAGGAAVTLGVLANDTDPNSDVLTLTGVDTPAHGTVTYSPTGAVTYTPSSGFVGTDTVDYTVTDGTTSAVGTVSFTVSNVPPTANPESASTATDQSVTVTVLANDVDPNVSAGFQSLSVTSAVADHSATVTINSDGTLTVVPATGYTGPIRIDYTVSDGAASASTQLSVTVDNAVPTALPDSARTPTDTAVIIDVLDNDSDANPGSTLTITSVAAPVDGGGTVRGTVLIDNGIVRFTPAPGWAGTAAFVYSVSDGTDSATASVTVTVDNADPVALSDTATTASGTSITVDVLGNDTDANIPGTDQRLSVTSVSADHSAIAEVLVDGSIRVSPASGFRGDITVQYTITDGAGGTSSAQLIVTVENAVPVAVPDAMTTAHGRAVDIDVLTNDTDANSDQLTVSTMTDPMDADGIVRGTVSMANGMARYTPSAGYSGRVAFRYTVSDGAGGTATSTATVDVLAAPTAVGNSGDTAGSGSNATAGTRGSGSASSLASTGGTAGTLPVIALILLLAGGAIALGSRRRELS